MKSQHYYDNQGNEAFFEDITLTQTEVDNEYYSWKRDEEGVYHFALKRDTIFGSVYVNVANASIDLHEDTYIDGLYLGVDMFLDNEQCHYVITGAHQLETQKIEVNNTNTTMVIDEDTCVDASVVSMDFVGRENGLQIDVLGSITSIEMSATALVVHNGGNVYISGRGIFLYGTDQKAPTFELGDEVKLITPASGGFVTMEMEFNVGPRIASNIYTVGTITIDGKALEEDDSNIANDIIIGQKDVYDITVNQQGEGVIEGNTSVYEGLDQEFTFTPATGYEISDVFVDGVSVGAMTSYTFKEVSTLHTLEVIFTKVQDEPNGNDDSLPDVPSTDDSNNGSNEDVPSTDQPSVDTGDQNNILLFTVSSLVGAVFIFINKKKRTTK